MEHDQQPSHVEGYFVYTNKELKETASDSAAEWERILNPEFLQHYAEELEEEAFDNVEVSQFMVEDKPEQAVSFPCGNDRYFIVFRACGDMLMYFEGDKPDTGKLHHYAHLACIVLRDDIGALVR